MSEFLKELGEGVVRWVFDLIEDIICEILWWIPSLAMAAAVVGIAYLILR